MKKACFAGLWIVLMLLTHTVLVNGQAGQTPSPLEIYEVSFADLGYSAEVTGINDNASYGLFIPGNAVLTDGQNYVDLLFGHTTAGSRFPASLVVTFNDQLAGVVYLDATNAKDGWVQFALSAAWFRSGYNRLTVALAAEIPCGEEENATPAASIHPESAFHLEYSQSVRLPDLATYPLPFAERSFQPETIYFVLPSNPTPTDIAAAATISAGLGRSSGGYARVASVLDAALTDEIKYNHHLIVIGQMDQNRIISQLNLPLPLDPSAFSPESGVIQEIVSPWNPYKLLLVVTGQRAEGVFKAGTALNREPHFLSMKGQVAVVEEVLPAEEVERSGYQVDMSFESLGYGDVAIYGSRMQNVDYGFTMPVIWQLEESPKLRLVFQHAAMVDPRVSSLDVRLNKVPVGGTPLDDSNRINGVLEIELPSWLLKPGGNWLSVQVKMDHPASGGDVCIYLDSGQIWTVIWRDSSVHLAYTVQSLPLNLGLFPYPFDVNVNLSDVVLVLPEQMSDEERDGLLRLATALGAMSGGSQLTLRASLADELDQTTKTASNLLVIGQPQQNALIQEMNDYLPQSFKPNSNMPMPRLDSVVLVPDPDRDVGFIQELVSPWSADRTILVVTGMTSRGVGVAFEALLTRKHELRGDLAVIEGDRLYTVDTRPLGSADTEVPTVKTVPPSRSSLVKIAENWW